MTLNTEPLRTLDDLRGFLEGSLAVDFSAPSGPAQRAWIAGTLHRFGFRTLGRVDRGLVLAFLRKVTGVSPAQMTRLVAQWRSSGCLPDRQGRPAAPFVRRLTEADLAALAVLDRLRGQLSGPAKRKLAQRALKIALREARRFTAHGLRRRSLLHLPPARDPASENRDNGPTGDR